MDLVVGEVVETLRHMANEASLLRYLRALAALKGSSLLARTRRITRIRLQVGAHLPAALALLAPQPGWAVPTACALCARCSCIAHVYQGCCMHAP